MSDPYSKDEMLLCCKRWFEAHCNQAELIGRQGFAEHPMLTALNKTLEVTGIKDRASRRYSRYFVAESVGGVTKWVADLSESFPLKSHREKMLEERIEELESLLISTPA